MNEKITKEIDFKYLDNLLLAVESKQFKYFKINEKKADITYLRKPPSLAFDIFKCGLMGEFRRQKYKIKEQSNLRKGSKDYLKIFSQNNLITKIDSFVDEKIDVVFLALYEGETRYLFPFSSNGGFYPTYKYVTRYKDGMVFEEYMVQSNQIVYEKYVKQDASKTLYFNINYVPNGKHKVLNYQKGVFEHCSIIGFNLLEQRTWMDELNK